MLVWPHFEQTGNFSSGYRDFQNPPVHAIVLKSVRVWECTNDEKLPPKMQNNGCHFYSASRCNLRLMSTSLSLAGAMNMMSLKGDVFYKGGPVSVGDSGAVDLQWLDLV